MWPLQRYLTEGRLLIVPDDALHTVPFAALPWSAASGDELLIEHAELAVVPSASVFGRNPVEPRSIAARARPRASGHHRF